MPVSSVEIKEPASVIVDSLNLEDIEGIRLILRGHSVIDWYSLSFRTIEEVNNFLRVNQYIPEEKEDIARLRYLMQSAVRYLEDNFYYHFPQSVKSISRIQDLFLTASSDSDYQNLACIVLKVMHIINHIEGRELRIHLPVSDEVLFKLAEERVKNFVEKVKRSGIEILDYQTSRKTRDSLITKLLAKRTTIAAQVFDKLRFRLIVKKSDHILPLVYLMKRNLFPYNYIIPHESKNDILNIKDLITRHPELSEKSGHLKYDIYLLESQEDLSDQNPFTGEGFRMINFVLDLPIRVDHFLMEGNSSFKDLYGRIIFLLIEFQIFDESSFIDNELGKNSHERYKDRQKWNVIRRLVYGADTMRRF
jgi:uncharacterized protein (TIGR04552 family)